MAKSLRSKVKRSFRAKKREEGVYAAASAARLQRLNSKLVAIAKQDAPAVEDEDPTDVPADGTPTPAEQTDVMAVDSEPTPSEPARVSTHGRRSSRREEWRASKGMDPRPTRKAMNRQGGLAAARKSGRSKRRR